MTSAAGFLLPLKFFFLLGVVTALIPATPREQTSRAIFSIKKAIEGRREVGKPLRLFVDYLVPLPPETQAEDIDPWPGGLAQMYPYAEDILSEILQGVVEDPVKSCSSQVISAPDCCGFFVQESKTSTKNDVAAVLFPGVDQLKQLEDIDAMVGPERALILFNKQFQRPVDFGFTNTNRSQKEIFDRYAPGFAFQEFACRGEDLKLTFEFPNWQSCVICEEEDGNKEIPVLSDQTDRPKYEDLEKKINEVLPEPLWMRKMGEVETKGFKFQRKQ
mmetsp:Transcript_8483/g.17686  ORF Transcript_8483/g.17686 Transcript_8483/m.17686 type:complete len:274 (-) Transcript_8483:1638-2459(-)|eukprot:CAMPEP_0201146348 /NCGR_PEP_ID=MMETSP0851-20130426/8043_1 /ASSEMBLY_ACC=CAM_ASM_000631 /TAXON_ID=183588 /ORGANISM="Pseudo-nitzschia fraudulenta, Strain WWA7" /LENGTH=273 /DNA_ID=CAMNT_0047421867 /DNA_START=77 /DNA_END=898 /DNA_ORIENTATION=+